MMEAGMKEWKNYVGFHSNVSSQSSDDDFDTKDVVMRNPRHSSGFLLEDQGDGAEVDLLGTTPPRSRIRKKEKRRSYLELNSPGLQRPAREKRSTLDYASAAEANATSERLKKRASLKLIRKKERDWKQDMDNREPKTESLPSPNPTPAVPTLVESCSRFMSLSSRPLPRACAPPAAAARDHQLPASRVSFHNTFSMLINMGNIDKGCRRTISREEQVWQNELKDLIWLELQAKIAGRTLTQQDAYLCAQRNIVPTLIKNISEYRFVSPSPCKRQQQRLHDIQGSCEDVSEYAQNSGPEGDGEFEIQECVSFECVQCAASVGQALREVGTLLDSLHAAQALYPSTKGMTLDHPLIATDLFKNRIKAMCLWYNTALNLRLKMLSVRRILRSMKAKGRGQRSSLDSGVSRQSSETVKCRVHFDVSPNPTDSSNSDSSALSDHDKPREDEVDSGIDTSKHTGQTTPEIVISEAQLPEETYVEGECASKDSQACADYVYDIGPLGDIAHLRLLDKCSVSLYREYHCEILKTQGVRRSMTFIDKMRKSTLNKAYLTLEKPDTMVKPEADGEDEAADVFKDPKEDEERMAGCGPDEEACKTFELKRFGWWSPESGAMRLPSYRGHFLLLGSICMEAVHDYLAFRLESRPDQPSCLTVKQLIHELKEGLDIASEMRSEYVRYVRAALGGRPPGDAAPALRLLLATFDGTARAVLEQYLSYLRTMARTEPLPRPRLQLEWSFTARLARRMHAAALLAPLTFASIACSQLDRLVTEYKNKFDQLDTSQDSEEPDRYTVYATCRSAQSIYACERDNTLSAAQWARGLAARLARAAPPAYLAQRGDIFNSMMAIRDVIALHTEFILEKSGTASEELDPADGVLTRIRELLLQIYKLGFELHKELYKYAQAPFMMLEEKLCRKLRPTSLQPLRPPTPRARRRPETMVLHEALGPTIHRELHRFVNDSVNRPLVSALSPRRSITSPIKGGKSKFLRSDSIVEDYETTVFEDKLFENLNNYGENQTSIEVLLSGEQPQPDEVETRTSSDVGISDCERQWAASVARAIIEFAKCWMRFVVERCDRGRGLRPRWASQGLEFLMLACDPCNTKHLSDEEFEELKQLMDGCISHVVGSRGPAPRAPEAPAAAPSPRPRHRLQSPLTSYSASRDVPTPPTPPSEPEPLLSFKGLEASGYNQRVLEAIEQVDKARDELLRSKKSVGKVVGAVATSYEPKLRQLTFKWQRGLKIGAGTFGKVYTVVNTESGQLLAMKELSVGAGDRRALQRAANELRVLEGVLHPHLVRYYGCELHREEMLLFMELCVEGSLEALVGAAGALAEHTVRRYTKQLLSAVAELHARGVAHRDIKSGNIFLTNEGHCLKLGDFGCAVKIRANTTAPGELQGFVGTQAYMAPEVFMKASGHGRAADIWSVGCVVTEMASGKRPFPECDSNYQIMFVVGMGGRPHIPGALSAEGQQLCLACLTHDPDLRPRADQLALHHFLMINTEDDCQCEPSFLIT